MSWGTQVVSRNVLRSQIGLLLRDDFTATLPAYPVMMRLELRDVAGVFRATSIQPLVTPSGVYAFPSLGRCADATLATIDRYRVLISGQYYRPNYLASADALEFDVYPADHATPPVVAPLAPMLVTLHPSASYPYRSDLRLVRGVTLDVADNPIANVEVSFGSSERVLSDERGAFCLPIRWAATVGTIVLDAFDHRVGRVDQLALILPDDLRKSQTFKLT
jgi:hypothetical protein